MTTLQHSPLGKTSIQPQTYTPEVLFAVERQINRRLIDIYEPLPFYGFDIWQEYEISWLDLRGKPNVAIGQFIFPCHSPCLIESKSLKLYLTSLNQSRFADHTIVTKIIQTDLSRLAGEQVSVQLIPLEQVPSLTLTNQLAGTSLDNLDVEITDYSLNPELLSTESATVNETLYTHLLKTNCPVTKQPDWGSLQISYSGKKINHSNLLKFIISFRNYTEFTENCVERIFIEILRRCQPSNLTVTAFYNRRGGKDINPIRSTDADIIPKIPRLIRQ